MTMADEELNESAGYSLADLADLDVSDIEEVRFVNLPAGLFGWEVKEADLKEYEKDGDRKFRADFELELIEVKSVLDRDVDKESLVGKRHTEKLFIDPTKPAEDVQKAIGRIRAFVADMGLDNAGKLGDIVQNSKGHTFVGKIVKQKDKEDKSVEYARLRLDPAKK